MLAVVVDSRNQCDIVLGGLSSLNYTALSSFLHIRSL